MSSENRSLDSMLSSICDSLGGGCEESLHEWEEKIRSAPIPSTLIAVAAGYVLSVLPLFALVGGLLRLALFLAKPALLIFGAMQLVEAFKDKSDQGGFSEGEREPLVDSPSGPA